MPERTASVTLSTINCRTICAWLAPSADRIAISRSRPALRASESPAMFAIAMISTNETAAVSIHNANRVLGPVTCRVNGMTLMPRWLDAGDCSSSRRAIALISVCACWNVTSGRSLATTNQEPAPRARRSVSQSGNNVCGSHTSVSSNWSSAGRMPIMRDGRPSITSEAPMASPDPPKRACQKP